MNVCSIRVAAVHRFIVNIVTKGEPSSQSWKMSWQESTISLFLIPETSSRFPADVVTWRSQGGYAAGAETSRSATEKQSSQILIGTF